MYIRGAIDCADDSLKASMKNSHPSEIFGKSSKCFQTDEGIPMCLKGSCNEESQSIDVQFDNEMLSCQFDGQIVETKSGVRIECPRFAAFCPSLVCPSNCSGRGVCDEDRDGKHSCICDDPFDDSPGCWGQSLDY